jgi:hypothetical protein
MGRPKDPEDVAASIQRSIEVSPRGSRRVRCHSLRALFGFQAWTAQRKELVASLLASRGIRAQPAINEAGLHDWIVLSLPVMPPPSDSSPDPRPSEEWFDHLTSVHLDSEREVEMYFASPLLHGLGYTSEHEAAGFRFDTWEGVTRRRVEADLVYFLDERHSLSDGVPLVLVGSQGLGPGTRCRNRASQELRLLAQARVLRHDQRRRHCRLQLPGRRRTRRQGAGYQALRAT